MALRKTTPLHREACRLLLQGPLPRTDLAKQIVKFIPSSQAIRTRRKSLILRPLGDTAVKHVSIAEEIAIGRRSVFYDWLAIARRRGMVFVENDVVSLSPRGRERAERLVLSDATHSHHQA